MGRPPSVPTLLCPWITLKDAARDLRSRSSHERAIKSGTSEVHLKPLDLHWCGQGGRRQISMGRGKRLDDLITLSNGFLKEYIELWV